ncbi:MAG: GNAT family N-acetyltransferase [Pseudomonadota bacterium]
MPIGINIRPAVPGDEYALGTVGAATFLESFTETIPGKDLIAHCKTEHAPEVYKAYITSNDPKYACWIAEYSGTGAPIGYAVTSAVEAPTEGRPDDIELKRIYVFSKYHGTGTGRELMTRALQHAGEIGAKRMLLGTYDQNHRAVAFYQRAGFEKVGERRFQVGGQIFNDIVMGVRL